MSHFKHPIRSLKEPFGKAGLIVAMVALVFALAGGAYAANHSATASKAKAGPRGKTGKTGPAGPAGATGPAGPAGTNGVPGKNGTPGKEGPEGSPWTAGGTLPSGQTETGNWSIHLNKEEVGPFSISFAIPLSAPLEYHSKAEEEAHPQEASQVHFILENKKELREGVEETQTACSGSAPNPKASKGNLCVYVGLQLGSKTLELIGFLKPSSPFEFGAGTTGAAVQVVTPTSEEEAIGSWAVTAP